MMQILVVEDEVKVANHLKLGLEEQGYQATVAYDGEVALKLFAQQPFELVLLDAIIPGKNGFQVCREMRTRNPSIKIIMLTALGTTDDKVEGLDSGADDYLVKPFDFRELLARIRAHSKRPLSDHAGTIKIANLELNLTMKTAMRDQVRINLTAKEFALLEFLMRHPRKVHSRIDITERVWDLDFDPGTNVVDVYVNILRKKIDKDFEPKLIHTRVGMGYYLDDQSI